MFLAARINAISSADQAARGAVLVASEAARIFSCAALNDGSPAFVHYSRPNEQDLETRGGLDLLDRNVDADDIDLRRVGKHPASGAHLGLRKE